jgi:hypothetical protein
VVIVTRGVKGAVPQYELARILIGAAYGEHDLASSPVVGTEVGNSRYASGCEVRWPVRISSIVIPLATLRNICLDDLLLASQDHSLRLVTC